MKRRYIQIAFVFVLSAALCLLYVSNSRDIPANNYTANSGDEFISSELPKSEAPLVTEEVTELPQEPTEKLPIIMEAELKLTGDLMVHGAQLDFARADDGSYDFTHSFSEIAKHLSDADFTIGNLETVFGGEDLVYDDYPMFNTPSAFGWALKAAGFDMVTTANNHCNDRGRLGLARTLTELDSMGLEHTGTFPSQDERDKVMIKKINGIRFAFVSYTYGTNGLPLSESWEANIMEENALVQDIKNARSRGVDVVMVFPHMGNEYESYTRDVFKGWAELMLKAGADIVIASHPHVLQPVQFYSVKQEDGSYRDAFVAYSMGNFISSQRTVPRESGLILSLKFEKEMGKRAVLKQVKYIPTWVKFQNAAKQPDIKVLSVYDALKGYGNQTDTDFQQSDIERLKDVHAQTTKMFLDQELPLDEIQNEYEILREDVKVIE